MSARCRFEEVQHQRVRHSHLGKAAIFDTLQAALDSLDPAADHDDLQFVRVVLVANTSLLMCVNGKEVVRSPEAALYLEVAPTCPAYYAMWSTPRGSSLSSADLEPRSVAQTL